jgi:hypothetical protein
MNPDHEAGGTARGRVVVGRIRHAAGGSPITGPSARPGLVAASPVVQSGVIECVFDERGMLAGWQRTFRLAGRPAFTRRTARNSSRPR